MANPSETDELERAYCEARGFEISEIRGLELLTDTEMNRVSPAFLADFAQSPDGPDVDPAFLSSGASRSLDIIDPVARALANPALCSHQASFWHCLRLSGVEDRISGFGRLLSDH